MEYGFTVSHKDSGRLFCVYGPSALKDSERVRDGRLEEGTHIIGEIKPYQDLLDGIDWLRDIMVGWKPQQPTPVRNSASAIVSSVLLASLPPNVPPSFSKIVSARFLGSGRKRIATATLEMFDGLMATVECWNYGRKEWIDGWAHRWISMDGGNISWNGREWERVTDAEPIDKSGDCAQWESALMRVSA